MQTCTEKYLEPIHRNTDKIQIQTCTEKYLEPSQPFDLSSWAAFLAGSRLAEEPAGPGNTYIHANTNKGINTNMNTYMNTNIDPN